MPQERLARLQTSIARYARHGDDFILHLARLLQTSDGVDAGIAATLFALMSVHAQLAKTLSKTQSGKWSGKWALANDFAIPRALLNTLCASSKSATDVTIDFWTFTRLWGLLPIYAAAKDTWSSPPKDPVEAVLVWAQTAFAVAFQVTENVGYLASKRVLPATSWPESRTKRWMAVSGRFWMGHVILGCLRQLRTITITINKDLDFKSALGEKGSAEVQPSHKAALIKQQTTDLCSDLCLFPLTLHLSYEEESESPVPESLLGMCGLISAVVPLKRAWQGSARSET